MKDLQRRRAGKTIRMKRKETKVDPERAAPIARRRRSWFPKLSRPHYRKC